MLDNAKFETEQIGKELEVTSPPGPCMLTGNSSTLDSALKNFT